MELTAGTLRPVPTIGTSDGAGHVGVLTRISGTRPDGRTFDDTQVLFFSLDSGRVCRVDQFVGAPAAVTAFWAGHPLATRERTLRKIVHANDVDDLPQCGQTPLTDVRHAMGWDGW